MKAIAQRHQLSPLGRATLKAIAFPLSKSDWPAHLLIDLLMKHRDWLRLQSEGEKICAVFRQKGYQCSKQVRRLSWKVIKDDNSYVLTWLPAPVGDWSVLPNDTDTNLAREQMWAIVQSVLAPNKEESMRSQRIQQFSDLTRPWTLVRLLPDARRYTVATFFNRADADDYLRFLRRFMPKADFEVVFDMPDSKERDDSELPK